MIAKKLKEKLTAETAAKIAAANAKQNAEIHIAELWDAATEAKGYIGVAPWIIHPSKLHGKIGSLSFRDIIPEDALALLDAFPPVQTVYYYDGHYKSIRPLRGLQMKGGDTSRHIDGAMITIDGGPKYGQKTKLEWVSDFAGELIELDLELRTVHGVTPSIKAHVDHYSDGEVKSVTNCGAVIPLEPVKLEQIKYSAGVATAYNRFVLFGTKVGDVRLHVVAWVAECLKRRTNSHEAYRLACAAPRTITEAVDTGKTYEEESLRAGTKRQWEALRTADALSEQEIAKAHWMDYIRDPARMPPECPIKVSEYDTYFSYYVWACAYLFRKGLLDDDQHETKSGKPYRYGSAWL